MYESICRLIYANFRAETQVDRCLSGIIRRNQVKRRQTEERKSNGNTVS